MDILYLTVGGAVTGSAIVATAVYDAAWAALNMTRTVVKAKRAQRGRQPFWVRHGDRKDG